MNRIVKVEITLNTLEGHQEGYFTVAVTKEFDTEFGGGTQVFREHGGTNLHRALDVARGMITVSPARRTE